MLVLFGFGLFPRAWSLFRPPGLCGQVRLTTEQHDAGGSRDPARRSRLLETTLVVWGPKFASKSRAERAFNAREGTLCHGLVELLCCYQRRLLFSKRIRRLMLREQGVPVIA